MPSAAESITAAITAAGGAISFEHYMGIALYGTGGFYHDLCECKVKRLHEASLFIYPIADLLPGAICVSLEG